MKGKHYELRPIYIFLDNPCLSPYLYLYPDLTKYHTDSLSAVKQMCGEHLPSTLVKVLYLFMDLPDLSSEAQQVEMISKMLMSVLIRFV